MKTTNEKQTNEINTNKWKKSYPIVMRNKEGRIEVIYKNRVEFYNASGSDTFSETDNEKVNDAEHEVEMALGSGYKRLHDSDNEEHWKIWDAGKEEIQKQNSK